MSGKYLSLLAAAAFLLLGSVGTVLASGNPILKLESREEIEIDLKMMVADLLPPLLETQKLADTEESEWLELLVDLLGVNALDRLAIESVISGERGHSRIALTLDRAGDGGLLAELLAVPAGEFRFGRYLKKEDTVAMVSVCNFKERVGTVLEFLNSPSVREMIPDLEMDEEGEIALFGVDLRRELLPLLAGELDLVVFPEVNAGLVELPGMALVFGASDGFALRDKLLEMAGTLIGPEAVEEMSAAPGEVAGAFQLFPFMAEVTYAVSEDFFLVTNAPDKLAPLLARPGGDRSAVRAAQYIRVDGDHLVDMLQRYYELAAAKDSEEAEIGLEMLASLGDEPIGLLEMTARTEPGRLEMELDFPSSLLTLQYQMLKNSLALAPRMAAAEKMKSSSREHVSEVDQAMTRYGIEHGGLFPEDLADLVEEGYLGALPDLQEIPLGAYHEQGYSYVRLRDEKGAVVGYYFFVYGDSEYSGYDVFSADNLADPDHFVVAADGKPDGVVSFAYDGVAIDQMENFELKHW